jgi:hypothetical protein
MSKIPQGEWSAIAARYAEGESLTRIAQSYGCTPPAIHYILKRSKQHAASNPAHRVNGRPDSAMTFPGEPRKSTAPEPPRAVEQRGKENGISRLIPSGVKPAAGPPLDRRSSLARHANRSLQCSVSEASPLRHHELLAEIRHSPPVWIMSFMAAPRPPSRRFAQASTPPSRRGRRMSTTGFAKQHRI